MFSEIVLHIGNQKTGTTSVQRTLLANRLPLKEAGILYPKSVCGPFLHIETLFVAMGEETPPSQQLRFEKIGDAAAIEDLFARKLKRLSRQQSGKRLILSCEHLMVYVSKPEHMLKLAAFLKTYTERLTGLVYVRHPVELIPSVWAQGVKSGGIVSLQDLFERPGFLPRFDQPGLIEGWRAAVDQLIIREFQGDAIEAFLRDTHLPEAAIVERVGEANKSLTAEATEKLLAANVAGITVRERKQMLDELRELPGEKVRLTPEQRDLVQHRLGNAYEAMLNEASKSANGGLLADLKSRFDRLLGR